MCRGRFIQGSAAGSCRREKFGGAIVTIPGRRPKLKLRGTLELRGTLKLRGTAS